MEATSAAGAPPQKAKRCSAPLEAIGRLPERVQFGLRKFAGLVLVEIFCDPVFDGACSTAHCCIDGNAIEQKIAQVR